MINYHQIIFALIFSISHFQSYNLNLQRHPKISLFAVKFLSFDQSLTRFEYLTRVDYLTNFDQFDCAITGWHVAMHFLSPKLGFLPPSSTMVPAARTFSGKVNMFSIDGTIVSGLRGFHGWVAASADCARICSRCSDEVVFSSPTKAIVVSAVQLWWRCFDGLVLFVTS